MFELIVSSMDAPDLQGAATQPNTPGTRQRIDAITHNVQNVPSNATIIQLLQQQQQQQQQIAAINNQLHKMQQQIDNILHERLEDMDSRLDDAEQKQEQLEEQLQSQVSTFISPTDCACSHHLSIDCIPLQLSNVVASNEVNVGIAGDTQKKG